MPLARNVSASQASDYYYERDPITAPEGQGENSQWFGSLKGDFNLANNVNDSHFVALLNGVNPLTHKTIVPCGVNKERRSGIDLAFSAPKSVSIAALHLGDKQIIEAHKQAVQTALTYIQDNFIYYREKVDDKIIHVKSDNMVAATFMHSTSRSNDPQLHTHSVILNITKTTDGKYKAISNEFLYRYQTLANNVYQNELASKLLEFGYALDNYENKFEIKGVSDEAIDIFSKRSKEIDELYEKYKSKNPSANEAELRDYATLNSREDKDKNISGAELKERWEAEYSKSKIIPVKGFVKEPTEKNILEDSLNMLLDTQAAFNKHQILNAMITQNRCEKSLSELKTIIENAERDNFIVPLGTHKEEQIYSTPEMIKLEASIVQAARIGKDKFKEVLPSILVEKYITDSLTLGQQEFIKQVLTTKDKINIVQGDAGTGKTFAIKVMNDIIQKEGGEIKLIGLGFTGKAASEISSATDIETSTIASFLLSNKDIKNSFIIVDEASMVSSRDMMSVIKKCGENRIVFVGDGKQLQAIGAGKMFKELQRENVVKTIQMTEVMRQKTQITKDIVKLVKSYQETKDSSKMDKLIETLEANKLINTVKSKSNTIDVNALYLREQATKEYLQNSDCLLLTSSRKEKDELNKTVRRKVLDGVSLSLSRTIKVRENVNASSYLASSYKDGDVVIYKGKEFKINHVDKDKNLISIEGENSKTIKRMQHTIEAAKEQFAVYRESEKDFTVGDKIVFTKNDKLLKVQNGLSGIIQKIDKFGNVTVKSSHDKQIIFNVKSYAHIDYGYAQTLHKAQGQTCDKAILVHNQNDKLSTEAFYVASTRAKSEFKIITTSKEQLVASIKKEDEKMTTRVIEK